MKKLLLVLLVIALTGLAAFGCVKLHNYHQQQLRDYFLFGVIAGFKSGEQLDRNEDPNTLFESSPHDRVALDV